MVGGLVGAWGPAAQRAGLPSQWSSGAALRICEGGRSGSTSCHACSRSMLRPSAERLDASPVAARRAMDERGVQVQVHDLSGGALPAEAGTLEAVTAFELIEHLGDPLQLLRGARGLLQPGGKLVVTVPRLDRRPALFHPAVDSPPHHMTLWTESALRTEVNPQYPGPAGTVAAVQSAVRELQAPSGRRRAMHASCVGNMTWICTICRGYSS